MHAGMGHLAIALSIYGATAFTVVYFTSVVTVTSCMDKIWYPSLVQYVLNHKVIGLSLKTSLQYILYCKSIVLYLDYNFP